MTPLETLAKYGLDTSVKAIRERLLPLESFKYFSFACNLPFQKTVAEAQKMSDEMRTADLSLLCSLAEKGERYEKAVKENVELARCTLEYVDDDIEERNYYTGRKEMAEELFAEIITEAEEESK